METTISKAGSFKGYKFKIWLKKNKETLKMLASGAVGVGIFFLPQIPDPATSAAAAGMATAFTKLIVDAVDFKISDVEILAEKYIPLAEIPKPPPGDPDNPYYRH